MVKRFVRSKATYLISLIISILLIVIEIERGLFTLREVDGSPVGKIVVIITYLLAQAVFVALILNATILNIKHLSKANRKKPIDIVVIIIAWILEFLGAFLLIVIVGTSFFCAEVIIIISLLLLCMGFWHYKTTRSYLSKSMIFWGIAILLFLSVMDAFYLLWQIPIGLEWEEWDAFDVNMS